MSFMQFSHPDVIVLGWEANDTRDFGSPLAGPCLITSVSLIFLVRADAPIQSGQALTYGTTNSPALCSGLDGGELSKHRPSTDGMVADLIHSNGFPAGACYTPEGRCGLA